MVRVGPSITLQPLGVTVEARPEETVPEGDVVISLLEPHESRFPRWTRKR